MRKQVILLVTTFVFAVALCGAVAAEDNTSTGGEQTYIGSESSSSLTNTPAEQNSTVETNISSSENGNLLPSTLTDNQGRFVFENMSPKTHVIWINNENLPDAFKNPSKTKISLTLDPNSQKKIKIGKLVFSASFKGTSIEGSVFHDLNGNGIKDKNEGLKNIKIIDPEQIHFLVISWSTESAQLAVPMQNIMNDHPEIVFKARTIDQAQSNLSEVPGLIAWADIIYLSNLQQGALSDLLVSLNNTGALNGKVVIAMGSPYFYYPVIRLTNFNGTQFVKPNGTPLTDDEITAIFNGSSRAPNPLTYLQGMEKNYPKMASYLRQKEYYLSNTASPENRERMLIYLLATAFPSLNYTVEAPQIVPTYFLYRNGTLYNDFTDYAKFLNPNKPTVGITAWKATTYERGDTLMIDTLISKLESKGFNVLPLIAQGNPVDGRDIFAGIQKYFLNVNYTVESIITLQSYQLAGNNATAVQQILTDNNILCFKALSTSDDNIDSETWWISQTGLPWASVSNQIALTELHGQIEPIILGASKTSIGSTGLLTLLNYPIDERINKLVARIAAWSQLKHLANNNKKVALIYYSPPGKQNIAESSYLDGPASIMEILNLLADNGYNVNGKPSSTDELLDLMILRGLNVANWAPGEVEKLSKYAILWDVSEYMKWYNKLPEITRKEIEEGPFGYIESLFKGTSNLQNEELKNSLKKWYDSLKTTIPDLNLGNSKEKQALNYVDQAHLALNEIINGKNSWSKFNSAKTGFLNMKVPGLSGWGKAPGNVMTINLNDKSYFIIPGMVFGNIFVGPQPQRGLAGNEEILYHSPVVPPTHQYLAFYAYLQTVYKANAMIDLGRHGTYEWLPGKDTALSGADYPDICVGNMPSLYIYIMDGVGEAMHAKRRGLAVIIDHLTPPLALTEVYGDLATLKTLYNDYLTAGPDQKEDVAKTLKKQAVKLHLDTIIPDWNNLPSDELVEKVGDYIKDLELTMIPLGLNIFGKDWTLDQITALAISMAKQLRLTGSENSTTSPENALSNAFIGSSMSLEDVIAKFYNGTTVDDLIAQMQAKLQRNLTTLEINALEMVASDVNNIKISPARERQMLLNGLNGGFIPPASGNDPIKNPAALPTGGNLYGMDPANIPTQTAWEIGLKMAKDALKAYGKTPEQLGAIIWATDTQINGGVAIAFVLGLMGVEPKYTSGKLSTLEAIPLSTLNRPRVDVLMTTSGIFRETFPQAAILLDRAARVALAASYHSLIAAINQEPTQIRGKLLNALEAAMGTLKAAGMFSPGNDPIDQNYIAKHWLSDTKALIANGINDTDAGKAAISRLFGPSLGNYGTRLPDAIQQSWTWENTEELGELYINSLKYAYTEDNWVCDMESIFTARLKDVEGIYHSRATNLYGVVDVDHNFEYLGGFRMAVETVSGKVPKMFILDQRNPSDPKITDLGTFLNQELQARYLNPTWIKGMMSHGYAGAQEIAKIVSNLKGWQVTSPEVMQDGKIWDDIYNTYLKDQNINQWLSSGNNAYAKISIGGTLLEMAYKGYWKPDDATLRSLANEWAQTTIDSGVACCDCSCGNIAMMKWATQYINPDMLAQFKSVIYAATGNEGFAPATPQNPSEPGQPEQPNQPEQPEPGQPGQPGQPQQPGQQESSAGTAPGEQQVSAASTPGDEGDQSTSHEVNPVNQQNSAQNTGMPIAAIVGVVLIVGLIGVGYFRTSILGFLRR
jgi:cobaltochelatase CobN